MFVEPALFECEDEEGSLGIFGALSLLVIIHALPTCKVFAQLLFVSACLPCKLRGRGLSCGI